MLTSERARLSNTCPCSYPRAESGAEALSAGGCTCAGGSVMIDNEDITVMFN